MPIQGFRARAVDLANRAGEKLIRSIDGYFAKRSLVGDHTFFDQSDFPWIADIEARVPSIRKELDEVLQFHDDLPNFQDISTDQYSITDDDRWKTFWFFAYGFTAGENEARCPETARVLHTIPNVTSAMFSILSPGKHIPPHGGPYKGVLRYHLALVVPGEPGQCRIRVGNDIRPWVEGKSLVFDDTFEHEACNDIRPWVEGKSLVFDDTFEHEAWNDTDGTRVVLFVDFKRPLTGIARVFNNMVLKLIGFSPFIQDARIRHNAWEKRFENVRNRAA